MAIRASRLEWSVVIGGLVLIIIGGIYCTVQIGQSSKFMHDHSAYVKNRDVEWKEERQEFVKKIEDLQDTILKNQATILENIRKK